MDIITIIILIFTVTSINYFLLDVLASKSTDINQYKLKNIYMSFLIALSYLAGYICCLYILRLYHVLDLKDVYANIKHIFIPLNMLSLPTIIGLVLFAITLIIFFILSFICLLKICTHHIFCIYLYYWHADPKTYSSKMSKRIQIIDSNLCLIGKNDLLNYMINQLVYKLFYWYNKGSFNPWLLPRTHPYIKFIYFHTHKYYIFFYNISPLIIILYDCIFNNFVITHLYYYLLIFVPIMLFKKVTTNLLMDASYFCRCLWKIYYSKQVAIYAISSKMKPILDSYLRSGLRYNIELGLDMEVYISQIIFFVPYDLDQNIFINNEGICLQLINDKVVICDNENNEDHTVEWILLKAKTSKHIRKE